MQLLEQPFLNGLFLKGLPCSHWQGGINIKTCTCKLREALAFQLLGRDGSSAIRLAKHYEPRLREAAPSGDTAHTCHTMPYFLVSPETWMISWEVFHIVSQGLQCFLRSNLLNSCARQVAPRLLPALPSRCTPLSSRLGHWTFPKGYGATWCVHLCHGCHRYSNLDSTNTNLEEKNDVVQSKQQRCWFLSSSVGSILKFSHAAMHMINDYL